MRLFKRLVLAAGLLTAGAAKAHALTEIAEVFADSETYHSVSISSYAWTIVDSSFTASTPLLENRTGIEIQNQDSATDVKCRPFSQTYDLSVATTVAGRTISAGGGTQVINKKARNAVGTPLNTACVSKGSNTSNITIGIYQVRAK